MHHSLAAGGVGKKGEGRGGGGEIVACDGSRKSGRQIFLAHVVYSKQFNSGHRQFWGELRAQKPIPCLDKINSKYFIIGALGQDS